MSRVADKARCLDLIRIACEILSQAFLDSVEDSLAEVFTLENEHLTKLDEVHNLVGGHNVGILNFNCPNSAI